MKRYINTIFIVAALGWIAKLIRAGGETSGPEGETLFWILLSIGSAYLIYLFTIKLMERDFIFFRNFFLSIGSIVAIMSVLIYFR